MRRVWPGGRGFDEAALARDLTPAQLTGLLRLDLAAQTVMPGLIDMHVHLMDAQNLPFLLAHGVTTVRDCGNSFAALNMLQNMMDKGQLVGPRLFYSGPFFDGPLLSWPKFTCHTIASPTDLTVYATALQKNPANRDFIKLYTNLGPTEAQTLIEQSQAAGFYVTAHLGQLDGLTLINQGVNGLEHLFSFSRQIAPEYFVGRGRRDNGGDFFRQVAQVWYDLGRHSLNEAELLRLFELMAERGTLLTPTLALSRFSSLSEQAKTDDPVLQAVNKDVRTFWQRRSGTDGWQAADFELNRQALMVMAGYAARFYRMGGRLMVGSDSPNGGLIPGRGLQQEMQLLVEGGLTPLEVIGLATDQAARQLELSPRPDHPHGLGRLAEGYLADLLILEHDPSENLAHLNKPRVVVKGGQFYHPTRLIQ